MVKIPQVVLKIHYYIGVYVSMHEKGGTVFVQHMDHEYFNMLSNKMLLFL